MGTEIVSENLSFTPSLGIATFFGYEGYIPFIGFSETVLVRIPGEEDFQEVTPRVTLRNILSREGANVYPAYKDQVRVIIVSPFIAATLFAQEILSFEDLKNAREVDGGIEIPNFLFLDAWDGDECCECTLRIERSPRCGYEIYATGEDRRRIL